MLTSYRSHALVGGGSRNNFDRFDSLVDEYFCPMSCAPLGEDPKGFQGRIETTTLGRLQLAQVSTTPLLVRRDASHISRMCEAPYLIKFQLEGEGDWFQRGRNVRLAPGDFVIASTAEPYRLTFRGQYKMPVLGVAASVMHHLTPDPDRFLGQKMSGKDASCGLLSGFVAQVVSRMSDLPEPMADRVETNILDLLGGVLATQRRPSKPALGSREVMLRNARGLIRDNLRNRRLGPTMIAANLQVSTRYVHKLFAGEVETLSSYVRTQRLHACRDSLSDPAFDHMTITDIAMHWGFCDLPHMSRTFRSEFGVSPKDHRSNALKQRCQIAN